MRSKIKVTFLRNHGVRVKTTSTRGVFSRFVPNNGTVTVPEAAAAVGSYDVKLYRWVASRRVKSRTVAGVRRVPVSELFRLTRTPGALADMRTPGAGAA